MKRRAFLQLGILATAASVLPLKMATANAADGGKKLTDKDILKDGQASAVANYCTDSTKQPNKACPSAKDKPGSCETCMFYNKDASLTDYKGGKYARCQLLSDPSKPQFVSAKGWCATFVAAPKA